MTQEVTRDADGNVVSITDRPSTVTVNAARKVGRENYGNEEFGLFMQVDISDLDPSDDSFLVAVEERIDRAGNFLHGVVNKHLGLESIVENGIVRDVPAAPAPKAKASTPRKATGAAKKASGQRSKASTDASKDELWAQLLVNEDAFWDNREDKTNPKAPDFKHKDSGEGLWLLAANGEDIAAPAFVQEARPDWFVI